MIVLVGIRDGGMNGKTLTYLSPWELEEGDLVRVPVVRQTVVGEVFEIEPPYDGSFALREVIEMIEA